jgi:hypothetical protein
VNRLWCAYVALALVACGKSESRASGDAGFIEYDASAPVGVCDAVEQRHAIEGHDHVAICDAVSYRSRPPSSGNHYPVWAAYGAYDAPIAEGFWVHDLEHGAVVLTYHCPDGCDADVQAAKDMIAAFPADDSCAAPVRARLILTPDPRLDVKFAASAWGYTLRASCFDPAPFRDFALRHYAQGPEDLCGDGSDVSSSCAPE